MVTSASIPHHSKSEVDRAEAIGNAGPPDLSKLDFPRSDIGLLLICLYCFQADQVFSERGILMRLLEEKIFCKMLDFDVFSKMNFVSKSLCTHGARKYLFIGGNL